MGGVEFFSLVEAFRAFGWAAIGIHFVYLYAIPGMLLMMVCHSVAYSLRGTAQRVCRGIAFALSCIIGVSFLVLVCINPTLKGGLILLCAAFMFVRARMLLRGSGSPSS